MKVAIVHDWLTVPGGQEKVLRQLIEVFPDAPIYTSVFEPENFPWLEGKDVRTSFLQNLPLAKSKHQLFALLRARAFKKFDLSEYDLVFSQSTAEAKGARKRADAVHINYCNTPTRYYWSHYEDYKQDPGLGALNPLVKLVLPLLIRFLRSNDLKMAAGVDHFIANSNEVKSRIKKYYGRDSSVIFPSVETDRFNKLKSTARSGFVVTGRQIPYKKIDLAVAACTELGLDLHVVGDGPEHDRLVAMAGPTIRFTTKASDADIETAVSSAEAYIFPSHEDFGIVPVEAMAAGTPVLAYGKGGALDTVAPGLTGEFFDKPSKESLMTALKEFKPTKYDSSGIKTHAEKFSTLRFQAEIKEYVVSKVRLS